MAKFKIPENNEDISWFHLPLNRTVKLLQWGGDATGNKLELALESLLPSVPLTSVGLTVLPDKVPARSTLFELKGSLPGINFGVTASVAGTTVRYSEDLTVEVKNEPTNQQGYIVDLLADVALTGNALQVHRYSLIILGPSNNTHILSQKTTGKLDCGDTACAYGVNSVGYLNAPRYKEKRIFPKPVHLQNRNYYLKPTSKKMADLRFNVTLVEQGITKIKMLLDEGKPVRVWLIHHDGFAPSIMPNTLTHYLIIFGYSATKFLYLDPWPHGSSLLYKGGMYPATTIDFMGELEFDEDHLEMGIASPSTAGGLHKYKVLAGP